MDLAAVWFVIVAFFWTGFFVLEGFDFGVGALHRIVGRTDTERRVAINAIGPVWDGNEVWLVVAGASMFAAFPNWYATWFSSLYLALWLVLAALILRGVSFEFRGKLDHSRWRGLWTWTLTIGSAVAPLLVGVGLGDLLAGLPVDEGGVFQGTFLDLLTPYGLLTGLTLLTLSLTHGAAFLGLRTTDAVRARSDRTLSALVVPALVLVGIWVVSTAALAGWHLWGMVALAVPLAGALVAVATGLRRPGRGITFAATAVTIGGLIAALFANLAPALLVSTLDPAYTLTIDNSSASDYSLQVMTIVGVVMVPIILAYQGWTYWVFRARVGGTTGRLPLPAPAKDV